MSDNHRTKVVLLAGGLGTRLRPITDRLPKCLVPIAGRPLLDYWFDSFSAAGLRDVLINNHHLPEQVRAYITAKNATGNFRVSEGYEPTLLGSAGTIHTNRAFADDADHMLIVYADNLSNVDLATILTFHRSHGGPMTMLLFRTQYPEKCGIAQLNADGIVTEFVEKPSQPRGNLANAGVYGVTADAYREMADMKQFDLGFDVLPRFVGRMRGFAWDGYHRDIGTIESLEQAEIDAPRVFSPRASAAETSR
jgi:mannose-1-phosphate guanylyltransferase